MRVRRIFPLLLLTAGLILGACGDDSDPTTPSATTEADGPSRPPKMTATVLAKGLKFVPKDVVIAAGGTVTWRMDDGSVPHNVTSKGDEEFASDNINDGKTFEHTYAEPGEYPYTCTLHPGMDGTVTVKASPAP